MASCPRLGFFLMFRLLQPFLRSEVARQRKESSPRLNERHLSLHFHSFLLNSLDTTFSALFSYHMSILFFTDTPLVPIGFTTLSTNPFSTGYHFQYYIYQPPYYFIQHRNSQMSGGKGHNSISTYPNV